MIKWIRAASFHFCTLQAIKNWTVGRPENEAKCREHGFCFQLLYFNDSISISSHSTQIHFVISSIIVQQAGMYEQQEHIYYVYLKDSCHLLSTYHRCLLHKSSPPLELGNLYWELKDSVAKYELLLLRALKFQIQVQLPHPVSSQCLFMLACWSRVSCAQPSGPSDTVNTHWSQSNTELRVIWTVR